MAVHEHQPAADLQGSARVHLQSFDRRTARGGDTFQAIWIIGRPAKVIRPLLLSWME